MVGTVVLQAAAYPKSPCGMGVGAIAGICARERVFVAACIIWCKKLVPRCRHDATIVLTTAVNFSRIAPGGSGAIAFSS